MASEEKVTETKKPRILFTDFDGWINETGTLFDTTHADVAKANNAFDEKAVYEPMPLLIGRGRLFPGLEKSLEAAEVDKEVELILPPEEAAGPRDAKLVGLYPMRDFLKQEIMPEMGLEVTIKNKTGFISAVTAGRVRVDFNNKLAGRTLKYKYKVVSEPKTPQELLTAVLKMDYGNSEGFSGEFDGKKAVVKLPDVCKYDQRWLLSKYRIVSDLREILDLETIQFVEEYAKSEKKAEKAEEKHEGHVHDHEGHDHEGHDHGHDHGEHDHAEHEHKEPAKKSKKPEKKAEEEL
jgi:FKBP-type peptidyl-prolyl cis-trans isomerase 2